MDFDGKLDELKRMLATVSDENRLQVLIPDVLSDLRRVCTENPTVYKQEDAIYLDRVGVLLEALGRFGELLEELGDVLLAEDGAALAHGMESLREPLRGFAVSARLEKEIRELHAKTAELRQRSQTRESARLHHREALLMQDPPACPKCRKPMILRCHEGSHFWGCRDFPMCWGKKNLSIGHHRILEGRVQT
jgi:hypothetical protein